MADEFGADLKVGAIRFTDQNVATTFDGTAFGVWNYYKVRHRYHQSPHRYMLPITSPAGFQGAKAAFVQLAADTKIWVADWCASRFATVPDLPDPDTGDADWIFLGAMIESAEVAVAGDQVTPLYSINGIYVYGRKNPTAGLTDALTFPRPPWLDDRFTRTVPSGKLKKGIITAGQSPGSVTYAPAVTQ